MRNISAKLWIDCTVDEVNGALFMINYYRQRNIVCGFVAAFKTMLN